MNLEIKKLVPELADDYFDFFDHRAFTDDSPYRCYCQIYQMSKNEYQHYMDDVKADPGAVSKQAAKQQILSGVLQGYLAYSDGDAIGWCNANDRANYPKDSCNTDYFNLPTAGCEMAVVCFEIAPEFRGNGVATALLDKVIADAKASHYQNVVSFPCIRQERYEWDCMGPVRLYEKAGFQITEERKDFIIMKKPLME